MKSKKDEEVTREQVEQLLDLLLAAVTTSTMAPPEKLHALSDGLVIIDRYMRHGGQLPRRWAERRTKCNTVISTITNQVQYQMRCRLEKGHTGKCEP